MNRVLVTLLVILLVLPTTIVAVAQDDVTPEDTLQQLVAEANAAAERAEAAAARAESDAITAGDATDLAFGLFGLFEGVTAVIGLFIPVVFALAGFFGFRRLISAEKELDVARERFERELRARQTELDALRDELKLSAENLKAESERATLAMSLLPLGERQYKAQDFTGALDTYRRALELDPNNLIVHYRLGYVYTQRGDLEQAERHLLQALETEDDFAPAIAALGYVYRRMGEKMEIGTARELMLNKAEGKLLEALQLSPKLVDEDDESWWGSLGGLFRRQGQLERAMHAYEQATHVTPHSSYPFSNLALLYMQNGERDRMLATYERVEQLAYNEVRAQVDNYWGYADLLTARLALGKVDEAEPILEMVFEIAPDESPYVFESLTDTLRRLADVLDDEAAASVRDAIERIEARVAQNRIQGETVSQTISENPPGAT